MDPWIQAVAGCICFVLLLTLSQADDTYFHVKYFSTDDLVPPVPNGVIVAIVIFGLAVALEDIVQWGCRHIFRLRVRRRDTGAGTPAAVARFPPEVVFSAASDEPLEEVVFLIPCPQTPSTAHYPQGYYDGDPPVLYIMERHPVSVVTEVPEEATDHTDASDTIISP